MLGYTYFMANAMNVKALLVGGLLGILATLGGVKAAHADCLDGVSREVAFADVLEGAARGYNCEVIELRDGSFEVSCDEVEHDVEARACSVWAGSFEDELGETDIEGMYEACMVVALHTGAVK